MTHEETIRALDELIVFLNRINTEKDLPYNLVDDIISRLRGMDISNTTIRAISNIKIESTGSFHHYCAELLHLEQEKQKATNRRYAFFTPEQCKATQAQYRMQFTEMLGFPLTVERVTPTLIEKQFVMQDGNVKIYRMQFLFWGTVTVYALYFEQLNADMGAPYQKRVVFFRPLFYVFKGYVLSQTVSMRTGQAPPK